eukprot:gene16120-biopygen3292
MLPRQNEQSSCGHAGCHVHAVLEAASSRFLASLPIFRGAHRPPTHFMRGAHGGGGEGLRCNRAVFSRGPAHKCSHGRDLRAVVRLLYSRALVNSTTSPRWDSPPLT